MNKKLMTIKMRNQKIKVSTQELIAFTLFYLMLTLGGTPILHISLSSI
jgi:hypothetical protein